MPGAMRSQLVSMSDERIVDLYIAVPATAAGNMHPFAWRMLLGLEGVSTFRTGADDDVRQDALHFVRFRGRH